MAEDKKKISFEELQSRFIRPSTTEDRGSSMPLPSEQNDKFNLDSSHFTFDVGVPESILIAGSSGDTGVSGSKSCSSSGGDAGCTGCAGAAGSAGTSADSCGGAGSASGSSADGCE